MRENESEKRLDYWLNSLQSRAKGSSVIVVGTHMDATIKPHPTDLQTRFNQIDSFFSVSCKTGAGIKELRDRIIELSAKKSKLLPTSYMNLRDLIFKDPEYPPFVHYDDLFALAKNNQEKLKKLEFKAAIQFLHQLGDVFWYYENPSLSKYVFLRPSWMIDAFKAVVTVNPNTRGLIENGWLYHHNINNIWPDTSTQQVLLELLHHSQVGVKCKGRKTLIPCRLNDAPPNFLAEDMNPKYLLRQFDFPHILPADLFPSVVASNNLFEYLNLDCLYNSVIVINDGQERLVLKSYPLQKQIQLFGRGAIDLAERVTSIIQTIISTRWQGMLSLEC